MTGQIDDLWEFKNHIRAVIRQHLAGDCVRHPDKSLEWLRENINQFTENVDRSLAHFAKWIIPIGEKLDAERRDNA